MGERYLHDHPGLDEQGVELEIVFTAALNLVITHCGEALRKQMPQQYLIHIASYLHSVVELPPSLSAESTFPDFEAELAHYSAAKSKKRTLLCTMCNSSYPTKEQTDAEVLFQPWVYKNKLSLYAGKNAGGICAICALELMLRQILLKRRSQLTGSKFEAQKTKYLTIYPNFFFTPETGAIAQGVLEQLRSINFFTVRKQLHGADITVADLMKLEAFASPERAEAQVVPMDDDDDDDEVDDDGEDEVEDDVDDETSVSVAKSADESSGTERGYIKYQPENFPGLFMFGMPARKDDNDTASWAMPAFLALALPLVTSTKVVISEMSQPLFACGNDFQETVVFDAPHPYLDAVLKSKRIRVNQLLPRLRMLTSIYRVNIDTYAKQGKPEWKHLSAIARALETDPLFLFSYLRQQQRGESMYASDVADYLHIYEKILEADLSRICRCVDGYTAFYHGGYQSHSILKPVDIVARAIINSPLNIEEDDLLWQIQGEIKNWLDRVRNRQATGYAVYWGKDIDQKEEPALKAFIAVFYQEVFLNYCQGERGLLRSRINRFKDGCEAYYIHQRVQQKFQEQEQEQEQEPEILAVKS